MNNTYLKITSKKSENLMCMNTAGLYLICDKFLNEINKSLAVFRELVVWWENANIAILIVGHF